MTSITIQSHKSYKYREVFEILEWRDKCVWKTKSIGYIHIDDMSKFPAEKYTMSSISTRMTGGQYTKLDPYLSGE